MYILRIFLEDLSFPFRSLLQRLFTKKVALKKTQQQKCIFLPTVELELIDKSYDAPTQCYAAKRNGVQT